MLLTNTRLSKLRAARAAFARKGMFKNLRIHGLGAILDASNPDLDVDAYEAGQQDVDADEVDGDAEAPSLELARHPCKLLGPSFSDEH